MESMDAPTVVGKLPAGAALPPLNREAVRTLQAGLLSSVFFLLTVATFGPGFSGILAAGLTVAAMIAGTVGLVLGHSARHTLRRYPHEVGRPHAWLGWALSLIGFSGASVLNGAAVLFAIFVMPQFWLVTALLFLGAGFLHHEKSRGERFFREMYDADSSTSTCAGCWSRARLDDGRWILHRWYCAGCSRRVRGVGA